MTWEQSSGKEKSWISDPDCVAAAISLTHWIQNKKR